MDLLNPSQYLKLVDILRKKNYLKLTQSRFLGLRRRRGRHDPIRSWRSSAVRIRRSRSRPVRSGRPIKNPIAFAVVIVVVVVLRRKGRSRKLSRRKDCWQGTETWSRQFIRRQAGHPFRGSGSVQSRRRRRCRRVVEGFVVREVGGSVVLWDVPVDVHVLEHRLLALKGVKQLKI